MQFILTTDTSCDSFKTDLDKAGVPWIPLTFTIDGNTNDDNFSSDGEYQAFYDKIAVGAKPTTSQINTFAHEEFFTKVLEGNKIKNIVHLVLSGGLSDTINSAKLAAENTMKKIIGCKVIIVDTISATRGHQILVDKGIELRDKDVSANDAAASLEQVKQSIMHLFMVDDLHHLKRGGRVSGASAFFGTLLKIKPCLTINHEGKLAVIKKAKGAKGAMNFFVDMIKEHMPDKENGTFYLVNANAHKYVDEFSDRLKTEFPNCKQVKGWIGPVIGAHTGSGTFGLAFVGKTRLTNK